MNNSVNSATSNPREKLMGDLKVVIEDAEELLKLTAGQAGEKVNEMRVRIQDRLHKAKGDLANLQGLAVDTAKQAARTTDEFVHERPWTAVGIAAGIGILAGMLISRR